MEHWTAGDYGGAFAGVVAALAAIGKGLAWLLNWQGARDQRRSARLADWETSLTAREKHYRQQLEGELGEIRQAVRALGGALLEVTIELRGHNPQSPAVARAMEIIRSSLPPEFFAPEMSAAPELEALARKLDERGGTDGPGNG